MKTILFNKPILMLFVLLVTNQMRDQRITNEYVETYEIIIPQEPYELRMLKLEIDNLALQIGILQREIKNKRE